MSEEALYFGATTEGERGAAEGAVKRLKAKLDEVSRRDPPIEMKFSLPDQMVGPAVHRPVSALWRAALPVSAAALDDDHGAPRHFFHTVVWRQFSELHTDLWLCFEQTTERLIWESIHADTADFETAVEPASLRWRAPVALLR